MNIGEANAVNTVVRYVTKVEDPKTTKREAREALAVLSDRAYKTLMGGATGDDCPGGLEVIKLTDEFRKARDSMIAESGPVIGQQRAALGSDRFARFTQGHATVQAMALFLVMSVTTVPQADYSDEAIASLRTDAADLRRAADEWARDCEQLADFWQAQRQEQQ